MSLTDVCNEQLKFQLAQLWALQCERTSPLQGKMMAAEFVVVKHHHHPEGEHDGKVVHHSTTKNKQLSNTGYSFMRCFLLSMCPRACCGCKDSCPRLGLLLNDGFYCNKYQELWTRQGHSV